MTRLLLLSALAGACGTLFAQAAPEVVATGLRSPQKMVLTPRGNFLVSEPAMTANAGRISFVTRGGTRRSLIEGLPSGVDVTGNAGSGPTGLAVRQGTLYVAIGVGDAERSGPTPGTSVHNTSSPSSPLFATVLRFRFNHEVDMIDGTFQITPTQQRDLADGKTLEIEDGRGGTARVMVLARFPLSEPNAQSIYKFSNPWGVTLSANGGELWVADASMNSLVRVNTMTGFWERVVRFAPVPNRTGVGAPVVDPVPTQVRGFLQNQLLVSYLTGFPFVPGNARVMLVNPSTGATSEFIYDLTSCTDFWVRTRGNQRPQFFVLEFSANQSAAQPPPGRLLRYDTAESRVAATGLIAPVSLAFDEATDEMFILELTGRILKLRIN
ncbi:hypothetical protein F183_A41570 [Bryobacterales bacterium F-183]|nr:hypothetical protein F183_A41570 [Bryobacterales bacterium F-183]